jgi:HEAT repeat protein
VAEGRRRRAVLAGHEGNEAAARHLLAGGDGPVRAAALGALGRMGAATAADVGRGLEDPDPVVRRRACQVAVGVDGVAAEELGARLGDHDRAVAEVAAWALGERGRPCAGSVVQALAAMATGHEDALCREAAVAALGAIGDAAGLAAVLAATRDRPAVRRRAVIALAAFEGPEVDAALRRALEDRDWQVRQAAEDLLA